MVVMAPQAPLPEVEEDVATFLEPEVGVAVEWAIAFTDEEVDSVMILAEVEEEVAAVTTRRPITIQEKMKVEEANGLAVKAKTLAVVTNALATFKAGVDGPMTEGDVILDAVVSKAEAGVVLKEQLVDLTLASMVEEDLSVDEGHPFEAGAVGDATK
mmetsp:Transcript_21243/g.38573  ORF Transcript_21243/g.38573 Transcript_21243/m.38573 type:complete len:157 (+) Transcript_21243:1735-2205(+)